MRRDTQLPVTHPLARQGSASLVLLLTVMAPAIAQEQSADKRAREIEQAADGKRLRLLGFERVELHAGESRQVTITADPRLLARFEATAGRWRIAEGTYSISLGKSAVDYVSTATANLPPRLFGN
jgi:beta-glucosidase